MKGKTISVQLVFALALLLFTNLNSKAQVTTVFEEWNTTSGTQNNFQRTIIRSKIMGGTTYYYVCGSTLNASGNYDILIQKKNAAGNVIWSQIYNGVGNSNDYGYDLQVSNAGSVYVCGSYYKNSIDSNNAIILKYNASGIQQWTYTFNGTGSRQDAFSALQVGVNAIVGVGTTYKGNTTKYDMLISRIDTSGNQVWTQTWDYINMDDGAVNLWNSGTKLFIAGGAQSGTTTYKYAVLNIKASDGSILGSATYGGSAFGIDRIADIQTDNRGNFYVTGSVINTGTLYDIKTIKLDSALTILWSASYDGGNNLNDFGSGLTVDSAGNVIVCGTSSSLLSGNDYVVVKYNKNGTQDWVTDFDGGINANDSATAIVVRDTNHIYVTGYSYDSASTKDYYTLKYNGNGILQWQIGFNTWGNGSDVATAIAIDSVGGVIVSGQSDVRGVRSYTTVKYVEIGVITPPDPVFSSSAYSFEENRGQLLKTDGNVAKSIRYYNKVMNPSVYFSDTATSYMWASIDSIPTTNDTIIRVDMKLVGGNNSRPYVMNKQDNHFSYLQGYYSSPIPCVPLYSQVIYPEVYPKTDLMYTSNNQGLKHYFIIKGGADASVIEMNFNGCNGINIVNDTLFVYTDLGVLMQPRATAFEIDNSGNRIALAWQPDYSINGNGNVNFINIGSYNYGHTLVFECDWGSNSVPASSINTLEWSTFLGGASSTYDHSWDIVANSTNRSWVSGTTTANPFSGNIGLISSPLTFVGGRDAFIASFSQNAHNLWIIYIGGSLNDEGHGLDNDGQNKIYQVGITQSTDFTNLSSSGIDYANQGGGNEGYFVAINSFGTLTLCDSYIGSAGGDDPRGVAAAKGATVGSLDLYIVGAVGTNITGFPLQSSTGYNQSTYGGGNSDAFIMRLDDSYNNVWTTLFGGSGKDWFNDVALRSANNEPVIVGITNSSTSSTNACSVPAINGQFPICNNLGAYNQAYGGGLTDACIVEFSLSNALVWSTYFGGSGDETTTGYDIQEPNITITNSDDVYLCGATWHPGSNFPFLLSGYGGSYNQAAISGQWAFIARFNNARQQVWTTLYGTAGQNIITSLDATSDIYGNVYFTGSCSIPGLVGSGSYCLVPPANQFPMCDYAGINFMETYLPSNPNNGQQRTYIAAFSAADKFIWGTLFGTDAINYGCGLSTSADKLYLSSVAYDAYNVVDNNPSDPNDYLLIASPAPTFNNSVVGVSRFDITQIVGVNENVSSNPNNLVLFPNPAYNVVNLSFVSPLDNGSIVQIVDLSGRLVIEYQGQAGVTNMSIDISSLASGMYFVRVVNSNTSQSEKLIINR
jgi:hypothetical protein